MRSISLGIRVAVGMASLLFLTTAWGICSNRSTYFEVNADSVYDKKTDLTWMRCTFGKTWKNGLGCVGMATKVFARDSFKFRNLEGTDAAGSTTKGWRVPSRDELLSIVNHHCPPDFGLVPKATIDNEIFPDTPAEYFLTHQPGYPEFCQLLSFIDGLSFQKCNRWPYQVFSLRLVRNGK